MEIFKLFGTIMVDNEKANQSISKTEQKAEGLGSKLGNGIKTAGKWGLAIGAGAVAAGTALFGLSKKAMDTLDRVDKLSQKIGISRQGFQEWEYILSQSGTDVEKLQVGLKTMVQRMDETAKGTGQGARMFEQLGVSVTDATGAMKSQEQVFDETVRALQRMPEGAEKSRLAFELFGKAGMELMPLLNDSNESLDAMRQRAHDLGIVLSDEAVDAGVKFQDTMDDLQRAFGGIMNNIGAELIPIFQSLADWIFEHMPEIKSVVVMVFGVIKSFTLAVVDVFKMLLPAIKALYDFLMPAMPVLKVVVVTAFEAIAKTVEIVVGVFEKVIGVVKKAVEWLTKWNNKDVKKKKVEVDDDTPEPKPGGPSSPGPEPGSPSSKPRGSHASGLAYVPYDGYVAELHKGERVLSRGEVAAVGSEMGNITINISGNYIKDDYDSRRIADVVKDVLRRELRR